MATHTYKCMGCEYRRRTDGGATLVCQRCRSPMKRTYDPRPEGR